MKTYLAAFGFLVCSSLSPCITPSLAQKTNPTGFIVHEWGTFTTLAGSDGILLPGLYHEEEQLPNFVQHFPVSPAAGGSVKDSLLNAIM